MQYILSLLPLLACPVGMGLMMWFMMRRNKGQAPPQADQGPMRTSHEPLTRAKPAQVINDSPQRASVLSLFGMCLNWKVVAGLAVVGVIVLVLAPQYLWAALPVLLIAACPLSMLLMMRGMRGGGSQGALPPAERSPAPAMEQMHDEQLAELHARLSGLQEEQESLARQIAERESQEVPIISEAESVARAATKRSAPRR